VDAFRIDTVKYVPHDFWNDFLWSTDTDAPGIDAVAKSTGRQDFLTFGEVYEIPDALDDTLEHKVASFLGTSAKPELKAVLEFPLYGDIVRVFAHSAPTAYASYRLQRMMDSSLYPNPYILPTFIDNHDVARFMFEGKSGDALVQALTFIFTLPGIPIVYYGTEQGLVDPNRQALFAGGWLATGDSYNQQTGLYTRIQTLSAMRAASKVWTHGALDVVYDTVSGAGPLGYRRTMGSETALVLMNTSKV